MRAKFSFVAVLCIFAFSASVFCKNALAGKLLQSNGRPLAYTEIELVSLDSNQIANDGRLTAISSASGKFTFFEVPVGKYTLSINFNEKPTDTSPFTTFFYPNTEVRKEAQIFEIEESSKFVPITFRLPPKLIERRITGQVVWADSIPVGGALVFINDIEFDDSYASSYTGTDKDGNFALKAFEGRDYLVRAVLFKYPEPRMIEMLSPILAAGYSDTFTLTAKTAKLKIILEEDSEIKNLRQRNIGKLIVKD